jgi:two-component system sensor histidine kinase QseC
MKLFTKYNRVNITATILTFLVGSIAFYFVLDYVLTRQLDRNLRVEQQEILNYIAKNNRFPEIHSTKHQWIDVSPAKDSIADTEPYSTEALNQHENEKEPIRQLFSL